jgi:hypothetical protein
VTRILVISTKRLAKICIGLCAAAVVGWTGVVYWRPFRDDLGFAMLFVTGSVVGIPLLTVVAIIATRKLFTSRSSPLVQASMIDTAFLILGVALILMGVAVSLRIAYGLAAGTHG